MERGQRQHLQIRNFYGSQQNRESGHYFHHYMSDNQNGLMSNYAPQNYGLPAAIHNRNIPSTQNSNSYTRFPSHQARQFLLEQLVLINGMPVEQMINQEDNTLGRDRRLAFRNVDGVMLLDADALYLGEEQIGQRSTGLSDVEIQRHLKMRNVEAFSDSDEEPDICAICQVEYESLERIGTLECGHEYHGDCITKWLQEKNVCPICKATGLTIDS